MKTKTTCSEKGCPEKAVRLSKCHAHSKQAAQRYKAKSEANKATKNRGEWAVKPPKPYPATVKTPKAQQKAAKPPKRRKASGDLELFKRVYEFWLENESNYCLECGVWLSGEVWNFAHIVGDGECGKLKDRSVAEDFDNIAPMCRDHHTQMDNAVGRTRTEMNCYLELERLRCIIVRRHNLKVRSGCNDIVDNL